MKPVRGMSSTSRTTNVPAAMSFSTMCNGIGRQSAAATRRAASDPTSTTSVAPSNKFASVGASATLLLPGQLSVCCIHRLNSPLLPAGLPTSPSLWVERVSMSKDRRHAQMRPLCCHGTAAAPDGRNPRVLPSVAVSGCYLKTEACTRRLRAVLAAHPGCRSEALGAALGDSTSCRRLATSAGELPLG